MIGRREERFKIHTKSVENSWRWMEIRSAPNYKNALPDVEGKTFLSDFPLNLGPRAANATDLKGSKKFQFRARVHLKDATNRWLLWSICVGRQKLAESKQSLSDLRSANAKSVKGWSHMKETLELKGMHCTVVKKFNSLWHYWPQNDKDDLGGGMVVEMD